MRRGAAPVAAVLIAVAATTATAAGEDDHGPASHAGPTVVVGYNTFDPVRLDVLTGQTVTFANDSARAHTVTADDDGFDSGRLVVGGRYARLLAAPGEVAYHCRLHAGMRGTVGVHALLLDAPTGAAGPGRPFPVAGRSALAAGTAVALELDGGSGPVRVGSATVAADGSFRAAVTPPTSGVLRAVAGADASPGVTLRVLDRRVAFSARALRGRRVALTARVTPAAPGARVVLQLLLPERFGWWPVRRARLDARSQATVVQPLGRRVPARVVLVLPDGATAVAVSPVRRIGLRRARPQAHPPAHRPPPRPAPPAGSRRTS